MKVASLHLPDRRWFAGIAIGVVVGVVAVGAVTAASPSAAAPSTAAPSTAGPSGATGATGSSATGTRPGVHLGQLRRAIGRNFRVEVTATGAKGTHNLLYVRGTLAVTPSSLTVTLPDNSTQTFAVDSSTVVRDKGRTVAFADLKDGERAMVFGTKNADGSYTAKLIRCVKEPRAAAAPAASPSTAP